MKERQAQARLFSPLLKLDKFSVRLTNYISIQFWIDIKPSDQDQKSVSSGEGLTKQRVNFGVFWENYCSD